ncbi:MAG TPA: hypothetical protein VGL38_08815 [bacterium]|jgi:tryptophan-rich sensory protein
MPVVSLILFLVGAIFGVIVWTAIFKNRPTPTTAVYVHGLIVVIAFIILLIFAGKAAPGTAPITAIVFFAIAAVGGLILFSQDQAKKTIPRWLAILHPIIAVLGVLALIFYIARPM